MRDFILEVIVGVSIALVICYNLMGIPGLVGGILGCIIGVWFVAIDYRGDND